MTSEPRLGENKVKKMNRTNKKELVIYYPYPGLSNKFHENMIQALQEQYDVKNIEQVLLSPKNLFQCKKVYFNNIENRKFGYKIWITFVILKIFRIEFNYVFHNYMQYEADNQKKALEKVKVMLWLSRNVYILSTGSERILLENYGVRDKGKIKRLDHINYIGSYPPSEINMRKEYGIPEKDFVFCFFGKVRPYKNVELLVRAFHDCGFQDAWLVIAGAPQDPGYADEVRELADQDARILFHLEKVEDAEVECLFRCADILVLPYDIRKNLNSGVAIAAFSYRKTVLISNTEMAKDFYKHGFLYMYEYSNEEEEYRNLKKEMENVYLDGKNKVREMGNKAFDYVAGHNNREVILNELKG